MLAAEPLSWRIAANLAIAAFIAMAVMVAVLPHADVVPLASFAAMGLCMLVLLVVAERARFLHAIEVADLYREERARTIQAVDALTMHQTAPIFIAPGQPPSLAIGAGHQSPTRITVT